jgi:hypothetical protein
VAVDSPRIAVVAGTKEEALAKFQAERAERAEMIARAQQEYAAEAEQAVRAGTGWTDTAG